MKLTIDLESYTLAGSGEGAGIIDCDVTHDRYGLPWLPGRRVKGLLRESALETLEMFDQDDKTTLDALFGVTGADSGIIQVPNLRIPGYETIAKHLLWMVEDNAYRDRVRRDRIIPLFTTVRQQTAVNENGIAADGSLRVSRLVNFKQRFDGKVTTSRPLTGREQALLHLAVVNLGRLGSRRNRGQGAVRCMLDPAKSLDESLVALVAAPTDEAVTAPPPEFASPEGGGGLMRLPFSVTLLDPVIISTPMGDQNTVRTSSYLPGTALQGMFAERVIGSLQAPAATAYENETFRSMILPGGLSFGPAFLRCGNSVYQPAPLFLHRTKQDDGQVYNLLSGAEPDDTTYVGGLAALEDGDDEALCLREPARSLHFHSSRKDARLAGRSTEKTGDIFTYESLDAGQEFAGEIVGTERKLSVLLQLVGKSFETRLGRSRSAQYGRVAITLGDPEALSAITPGNEFQITVLSPLILFNDQGFPEPSERALCHAIASLFPHAAATVTVVKSFAATTAVESYNVTVGAKTPRLAAFAVGSAFKVRIEGVDVAVRRETLASCLALGIGEKTGDGYGRVLINQFSEGSYRVPDGGGPRDDGTAFPEELRRMLDSLITSAIRRDVTRLGSRDAGLYDKYPRNHQIGRLIAMLDGSDNLAAWLGKIGELKKPARDALSDCRTGNYSLLCKLENTFAATATVSRDDLLNVTYEQIIVRAQLDRAQWRTDQSDFDSAKHYWRALLTKMRKLNKREG